MKVDLALGHTALIRATCDRYGLTLAQTAYVLATAYWETARTMRPVEEAYYLGAKADAYRRKLRYWPWHGRGFVQLTWRENYVKAGRALGRDFTADPDAVMQPDASAEILVRGMIEGWFTGKKLADYVGAGAVNYAGARRVVNGTDRAAEIAAIAAAFEAALRVAFVSPPAPPRPGLLAAILALLRRIFGRS